MTRSFKGQRNKMILQQNGFYLDIFLEATTSAAPPAEQDVADKYEAAQCRSR